MWYEHQYCLIIDNRIVAGSDVLMQEVKDSGYDHIDDFFLAKVTPAANIKLPIWEGKLFIPENSDEAEEFNFKTTQIREATLKDIKILYPDIKEE